MELQKLGQSQRLLEIQIAADVVEARRSTATQPFDRSAVSGSTPVFCTSGYHLCLFVVFAVVKITTLNSMMQPDDVSLTIALQSVWDEEPQALFAAVMSFWFGSRQISKMRHITDEGLGLIKRFEEFSPTIYLCSAGYPTIGFGHVVLPGEQCRFDGGIIREETA